MSDEKNLIKEIEILRAKIVELTIIKGGIDEEILSISEKLDVLISKYQSLISKKD